MEFHCSFCGKSRSEVLKLISGPGVFICDECVGLCHEILAAEDQLAPATNQGTDIKMVTIPQRLLGAVLRNLESVDDELRQLLAEHYATMRLGDFAIKQEVIDLLPETMASKYWVIPVDLVGSTLIVAMSDPSNELAIKELISQTRYEVEPVLASEDEIACAMERYYGAEPTAP